MIKKFLSLATLSCMLFVEASVAQTPEITRSTGFEEPASGACKLLEMKNGTTMFLHFTKKKGIEATVFNAQHKMSPMVKSRTKSIKSKKLLRSGCEGIYEINGNAVLFLTRYVHRKPILCRLVFDGRSGRLTEEKVVADISRLSATAGYAMVYGGVSLPSFTVEKDPESDYYAIATLNTFAHESNARIKITHYSPEHKVINEGYYASPDNKYKYLDLQNMYVHGDEYVFLTTFGYNTAKSGGKESGMFVSHLSKGSNEIKGVNMNTSSSILQPDMALKYNPANKQLYIFSAVNAKSLKMDYTMLHDDGNTVLKLNTVNPATLEFSKDQFINHPDLSEYASKKLQYKHPYTGVIQDFRLHEDGSATIMYEELYAKQYTSTSMSTVNGRTSTSTTTHIQTTLGDIGIVRVSQDGKELPGSYAIAKNQVLAAYLKPYFVYRRQRDAWSRISPADRRGFFSFDYLYVNDKAYAMYNDFKENIEKNSESYKNRKKMRTISDANTVLAWYDGEKIQRSYLFGDPGRKDVARFTRLDLNTHSKDGKSFSTLMIERNGRKKEAHIVWVKF